MKFQIPALFLRSGQPIVQQLGSTTLRTKLIASFLVVALIPLLFLTLVNKHILQRSLTNSANQALLSAASQTATNLDTFVQTNRNAVEVEAQLPVLAEYLSLDAKGRANSSAGTALETTFQVLRRRDTDNILSYFLLDRQGVDVIDTDRPNVGQNYSAYDYFGQVMKTGQPYVSPIRIAPTGDQSFSLYFSSPVKRETGEIVGVLGIRYKVEAVQQRVVQANGLAGPQSFAILLDENYIRLAHGVMPELVFKSVMPLPANRVRALQNEGRLPNRAPDELTTRLPVLERNLKRADTQPYFSTQLAVGNHQLYAIAVTKLSTQPWLVAFAQPRSVFLAPVQAQTRTAVILTVMIGGAIVAIAFWLGQLLATPITSLTHQVTQFTAGNLRVRAFVQSRDEIGILAASFNAMAEQVGKLLQGLEDRTRELEASQHVTFAVSELSKALLDTELLLQEAVRLIQRRFGLYYVQIYLWEPTTGQLIRAAQAGKEESLERSQPGDRIEVEYSQSVIAASARRREIVLVNEISTEKETDTRFDLSTVLPATRSEVAVPLMSRGTLLGVLDIQDQQPDCFSKTDLETFNSLAGQIAIALENARLLEVIQKTEERFRTVFEDAPIGMAIANVEDGRLVKVNKALCEMLGYAEPELMKRSFPEITHPDDLKADLRLFEQMSAGAIASYQVEKRYLTQNQEILWANLTATLIRDQNGTVSYSLGMIQNITERRQAEAALRQSEAQYRSKVQELQQTLHELQKTQAQLVQSEKMSSLGQLVAGVAHEINNPVNFIYGNLIYARQYLQDLRDLLFLYQTSYPQPAQVIQDKAQAVDLDFITEDFDKILASMQVGAERIRQIVLSLRNFSRLDEAEMKPVDVHEGIDSTLVILQNQLKAKAGHAEIRVIKEYGELPQVDCYAGQLNQVLMNLLTNAIDALDAQAERRSPEELVQNPSTIWIRTEVLDQEHVLIRVVDNGPGMSKEVQQRLFDPFFTTKTVGKGTGLGLSISYQIVVEKHKGQLRCVSEPGKGAEFIIQIPIQQRCLAGV